jgi:eukaryotic-like serine/threonine-protein kinase
MNAPAQAVFLSYASQDADAARRIAEALRAAGIVVWFDREELRGGDAWDAKIRRQIKECALFVPVISAHTDARVEGYFRREWRLAVERMHDMADDAAFLVPVVIDETPEAQARVPDRFRERQWTRLIGGEMTAAFAERVAQLLRAPAGAAAPAADLRPPEVQEVPGWRPAAGDVVPDTPWVLEAKLGEGGFGEVWLGRHPKLNERRVFKFCFRADRVRALKRELTLFRVVKEHVGGHPNIVRLLDVHFDEPPYYVEMDYVEGRSLKAWCDGQGGAEKVPLATRVEIVAQIADALHVAHAAGVIHRDVKPGNILIAVGGASVPADGALTRSRAPASTSSGALEIDKVGAGPRTALEDSRDLADLPVETRRAKSEAGGAPLGEVRATRVAGQPTAKLSDFGIGQVVSAEVLEGVTKGGFTQSILAEASPQSGTQLYMAPELLAGEKATPQSDIYSLGVVLFQLLVGDLHRPLTTDWPRAIADPCLREDLERCFAGRPEDRFARADALAQNLRALPQRRAERAEQERAAALRVRRRRRWRLAGIAGAAALVVSLAGGLAWMQHRGSRQRWAREVAIPEALRFVEQGDLANAYAWACAAEDYIPDDPALTSLWPQISAVATIETTPPGADVYVREYRRPESAWRPLGRSPLPGLRMAGVAYRWRFVMNGYSVRETAMDARRPVRVSLDRADAVPSDMVRIEADPSLKLHGQLTGLQHMPPVRVESFLIDRFEVTNRQFREFIDRGGYSNPEFWRQPFVREGKEFPWNEAVAAFRDATGVPGPATWRNGTYAEGGADFPVTGVSWFEAAAYAEAVGKRLPSLYHWAKAAAPGWANEIVPLSNFAGQGPARVGSFQGMSPPGTFDMAGNAREWCWNQAGSDQRYILGGDWRGPEYLFYEPHTLSPFDRSPGNGFRCIRLLSEEAVDENVDAPVSPPTRNYTNERPVGDEVFQIYRSLFSCDRTELDSRVEGSDDSDGRWRREKVSFRAAYGDERVTAYLFLPSKTPPPYQTIVWFPNAFAIRERSSEKLEPPQSMLPVIDGGRAMIWPIYKGTYERQDGLESYCPAPTSFYRDHVIQWSKDLGRAIDYLETRQDIQPDKLAFAGASWGGAIGGLLPALESRLRVSVLIIGGFHMQTTLPEVDQINYAPRITIPTLMLNGRYDSVFPLETSQLPMFQRLGTPPEHKRHVLYDAGHGALPIQSSREILAWLDKYLGPVR